MGQRENFVILSERIVFHFTPKVAVVVRERISCATGVFSLRTIPYPVQVISQGVQEQCVFLPDRSGKDQ